MIGPLRCSIGDDEMTCSLGGSHLPDMTVMTPVFAGGKPVFFVASRGHHSDIGGISPGILTR